MQSILVNRSTLPTTLTTALLSTQLMPREVIQHRGVEYLSTQQLLVLILGSGSKKAPVKKLAQLVHQKLSLRQSQLSLTDLLTIRGMGLAKSCQILAALELVERLRPRDLPLISNKNEALAQLEMLKHCPQERLICLYLNARHQLVHHEVVAVGSLNQLVLQPCDIFRPIKSLPIMYLILAHSHPSGDPSPSSDDLVWTKRVVESCALLGLELVDHIVVARDQHYSFKEHGEI